MLKKLCVIPSCTAAQVSAELIEFLQNDGVLFAPTDTVFGIICQSTEKIQKIKNKPQGAQLQSLLSMPQVEKLVATDVLQNKIFKLLTTNLWPGGLSLIVKTKDKTSSCLRVPNDDFLLNLLTKIDKPLFASSLNPSGQTELWEEEAIIEFAKAAQEEIWLFFTPKPKNKASTLIEFTSKAQNSAQAYLKILRWGMVTQDNLMQFLLQNACTITAREPAPKTRTVASLRVLLV